MKNKILTLFTMAMVIASASFAQGFHAGIKGGVNLYKVDGRSFEQEFKHGYNLGAFAEIDFSKKWGIQPEVMWNQANTQLSNEFDDIYDEGISELKDVKLNYLSIPVLLSYKPSSLLTLQAGPQFGILINNDESLFENGRDAFKRGDFSLVGGVQLNLGSIKAGGRYVVGLSNINDIDNRDEWKNQGFHLYVGFKIL
jgi:hypothetical protein